MVRCKEASAIISTSVLPERWSHRLAVRFHLFICPDCRAFRRQVRAIAALAEDSAASVDAELSAEFETDLVRALSKPETPETPA